MTVAKKKAVSFKNILGETYKLTAEEAQEATQEAIAGIVDKVSEKIIELNGGNSVSAVFIVGGGGKMPGYTGLPYAVQRCCSKLIFLRRISKRILPL